MQAIGDGLPVAVGDKDLLELGGQRVVLLHEALEHVGGLSHRPIEHLFPGAHGPVGTALAEADLGAIRSTSAGRQDRVIEGLGAAPPPLETEVQDAAPVLVLDADAHVRWGDGARHAPGVDVLGPLGGNPRDQELAHHASIDVHLGGDALPGPGAAHRAFTDIGIAPELPTQGAAELGAEGLVIEGTVRRQGIDGVQPELALVLAGQPGEALGHQLPAALRHLLLGALGGGLLEILSGANLAAALGPP